MESFTDNLEEEILKWAVASNLSAVRWYPFDPTEAPRSRAFRRAWRLVGNQLVVDLSIARQIHMDRIRAACDKALAALDVPFLRALEADDVAERRRIVEEKQRLRAIRQTFDLSGATTPEALNTLWPPGLPRS